MGKRHTIGLKRGLTAGLTAGAAGGIAGALLAPLLDSPDRIFFNSATAVVAALTAGIAAGYALVAIGGGDAALRRVLLGLLGLFAVVAAGSLVLDALPGAPIGNMARWGIPIAAVTLGAVALLLPLLARWTPPAAVAGGVPLAAVVAAVLLAGRGGGGESGRLALPALPAVGSPTSAAATATGPSPVGSAGGGAADGLLRPSDVQGVTFVVASGESAATYTVREKLAQLPLPSDAVGKTSAITGTIRLDGQPSHITVDLRTFKSDSPQRDNFIRTRGGVQSDRYPNAEFTVTDLAGLPSEYRLGETVTRAVTGTMKIREVERPMTFNVEARMQDNVLYVVGRTDFTWADFQIPPPNIAGIVQVENNVHIEVLLVARPQGQG